MHVLTTAPPPLSPQDARTISSELSLLVLLFVQVRDCLRLPRMASDRRGLPRIASEDL